MKLSKKLLSVLIPIGAVGLLLGGCSSHSHRETSEHTRSTVVEHSSNHKATSHKNHKATTKHKSVANKSNNQPSISNNTKNSTNHTQSHSTDNLDHYNTNNTNHNPSSNESNLTKVNLANGVIGRIDHGAGQTYISFQDNGHNFVVHGNNFGNGNEVAINKARQMVLNSNKIPKNQKTVNVDATIG